MSANKSSNSKNTEDGNGRDKGSAGANTKPSKQGVSIAVSSRALFDMEEERKIYENVELERYVAYQQPHEDEPLKPGVAFQFVQALLAVNTRLQELDPYCMKLFNIILMSNNHIQVGLRLGKSIKKYGLDIERFSLTRGRESPVEYLKAYETKLYLSMDGKKVRKATEEGIKAVLPTNNEETRKKKTKRDPQQKGSADPAQDAVTIVISSSALFNTDDDQQSVKPGAAFPFLKAVMTVNAHLQELYPDANGWNLCKTIVLNDCTLTEVQLKERIQEHGLEIEEICSGDEWPAAKLYLFTDVVKVKTAIKKGFEAAHVCKTKVRPPSNAQPCVAFDGDAVLSLSLRTLKINGLDAFLRNELKEHIPLQNDAVTIVISSSALFKKDDDQQSLEPGAAIPIVKAMMTVNTSLRRLYPDSTEVFNIVLLHDDQTPYSEEQLRGSIATDGLEIKDIHSIGRNSPVPYLKVHRAKLYLCMDTKRAKEAITKGFAAAVMFNSEELILDSFNDAQLRVAFDGDAVVFCDESERVMHQQGLEAFLRHEQEKENTLLEKGPLKCFLEALGKLQRKFYVKNERINCPVQTYLVTARSAASSGARVLKTLRSWGLEFDDAHFLAGAPKGPLLEKIRPHIFFDDQMGHIESAQEHGIIAAHVPYGIKN